MRHAPARFTLPLVLLGTLVLPPASAQAPSDSAVPAGRSDVVDPVGLFGQEALAAARLALRKAERETGISVLIEVVEGLRGEPLEDAARQAAQRATGQGVFVLIAKQEKRLQVLVRRPYESRLPKDRQVSVRDSMLDAFKTGDFDGGLRRGVDEIIVALRLSTPAAAPAGHAGPTGLIVRDRVGLTLAGARKVLEAAEAKAVQMNLRANIAIVDDGGHLLTFARMDGARPASAVTAQTKAISAATFRQATGPLPAGASAPDLMLNLSVPAAAASGGGRITPLLGGLPIEVDGQVVGAIGVGGGTGEQDAEVARAGVESLLQGIAKPAAGP